MTKSTAVATQNASTEVAAFEGYEEFDGGGFENHTKDDYSIPFISLLQALSPMVEERDDAKAGMMFHAGTDQLFSADTGFIFQPCYTEHVFCEWVPRSQGGGMVARHEPLSEVVADARERAKADSAAFGKLNTRDGNDLVETFYVYGIAQDDEGNPTQAVMSFSSTKIKRYKNFMNKARSVMFTLPSGKRVNPPLWAIQYRITAVKEKNTKGDFWNYSAAFAYETAKESALPVNDPLFQMGRDFNDFAKEQGSEHLGKGEDVAGSSTAGSSTGGQDVNPDDVPF